MNLIRFHIVLTFLFLSSLSFAKPFSAYTGDRQVHLIEFFTPANCKSCNAANKILSALRGHKRLWKSFIPIVFHVTPEKQPDPFAKKEFSLRHESYSVEWGLKSVVTPQIVVDGKEWTPDGTRKDQKERLEKLSSKVGSLYAKQNGDWNFRVSFSPVSRNPDWVGYGAILANGIETDEKDADQNFVALSIVQSRMVKRNGAYRMNLQFPQAKDIHAKSLSVVFWVSQLNEVKPEQAVGGDLPVLPKHNKRKLRH